MSFTYDSVMHMSKPSDGDQAWGNEMRANIDAVGAALAPTDCYFVSPAFTTAALGNASATDRRHFPTIQEAITAAEVLGYSQRATIWVWPGAYQERLTITKTVTIQAFNTPMWGAQGGFRGVTIRGNANTPGPVITVNPPNTAIAVNFGGLCFENNYNLATAVPANTAYLLDVAKQVVYDGNPVWVGFQNCDIRMQTWGASNTWDYGLRLAGFVRMFMTRVRMSGLEYGGGNYDGGIRDLISMAGDNAAGKTSVLKIVDSDIYQSFAGTGVPRVISMDDKTQTVVSKTAFSDTDFATIFNPGAVGVNTGLGVSPSDYVQFGNLIGVNQVLF